MTRVVVPLLVILLISVPVRADDTLAKRHFEQGLALASAQRWDEAAMQLESSLAESDRPAARFNLVVVYSKLARPHEVIRHALAFLATREARAHDITYRQVAALLERAKSQVATVATPPVPPDAPSKADTGPARVQDHPRPPAIEAPLVRSAEPLVVSKPPALRARLSLGLGLSGAALGVSALAVYGVARKQERHLEQGAFEDGYFPAYRRYQSLQRALLPLALTSGASTVMAILIGPRINRRRHWGWSLGSLASGGAILGLGLAMMSREPAQISGTNIDRLQPMAGALLASGAAPLLAFAAVSLFGAASPRSARFGFSPSGIRF